jgi:glucose-6-phosphate 1-dehydrogenase
VKSPAFWLKPDLLFMRADQVEVAWRILMPVLSAWKASPASCFPNYASGNWRPHGLQGLLVHQWHRLPTPVALAESRK